MSTTSQAKETAPVKKKKKKPATNWKQTVIIGVMLLALVSMVAPNIMQLFSSFGDGKPSYSPSSVPISESPAPTTENPTSAPLSNTEPMPEPRFIKEGELFFQSASSGKSISKIDIEKAENDIERAQGLMFRKSMPEDQGMFFVMDNNEQQSFWMHNTYIPLDIMFVDENGVITTIHENAKPLNDNSLPSNGPAKFVVEVNGGYAKAHGIKVGDKISWQ